ncbi:MAG: DnaA ATPase domain-containing protein, partial [Spirochaetota bacterium]
MSTDSWDYSLFWNEALKQIRKEISDQEFSMWFSGMKYDSAEERVIVVSVPSSFYRDQVKQRYLPLIEGTLHELAGTTFSLSFVVRKSESTPKERSIQREQVPVRPARIKTAHRELRQEYTFDNFVIGENNSFAANAAVAISRNPGTGYNPCLIYGGVGLGKTHLIQSIGNSVHAEFDDLKIVYVTAESFTNEFIQSIREK